MKTVSVLFDNKFLENFCEWGLNNFNIPIFGQIGIRGFKNIFLIV